MTMYTRCPECRTAFRVTTQQLQASAGQVRCGRCQVVFDAFATLSAQPPPAPAERLERPLPERAPEPAAPHAQSQASELPPRPQPEPPAPARPAAHAPVPTPPRVDDVFDLDWLDEPSRPARWPWTVGAALLLVVLAAQAAFHFRTELSAAYPMARPWLLTACARLGCTVPLPRLPEQLSIDASELQATDPARPDEIVLSAVIANRAAVTQAYPHLELTLTDAGDQAAARIAFAPAQYLAPGKNPGDGLAPASEVAVRLYLSTGNIRAAGYRMRLVSP